VHDEWRRKREKEHQSQSSSSLCFESKLLAIQNGNFTKGAQNMEDDRSREHFFVFKRTAFVCLKSFFFTQPISHRSSYCHIFFNIHEVPMGKSPNHMAAECQTGMNTPFRSHLTSLPSCSTALNRRSEGGVVHSSSLRGREQIYRKLIESGKGPIFSCHKHVT